MPSDYKYKEFEWPSSIAGEKLQNSKVKSKHLHLHNKESLNSIFTKIINVSSSSEYNVNLFGFNCYGRTDLMILQAVLCVKN